MYVGTKKCPYMVIGNISCLPVHYLNVFQGVSARTKCSKSATEIWGVR